MLNKSKKRSPELYAMRDLSTRESDLELTNLDVIIAEKECISCILTARVDLVHFINF